MRVRRTGKDSSRTQRAAAERPGHRHAALGFVIGLVGTLGWAARGGPPLADPPVTSASPPAARLASGVTVPATAEADAPVRADVDATPAGSLAVAPRPPPAAGDGADGLGSYSEDYDAVLARLAAEGTLEPPGAED